MKADWEEVLVSDVQRGDLVKIPWNFEGDKVASVEVRGLRIRLEFSSAVGVYFDWDKHVMVHRHEPSRLDAAHDLFELAAGLNADGGFFKRANDNPDQYFFHAVEHQFQQFKHALIARGLQ